MATQDYKYDLALSFLAEDEDLATQLTNILQDRVSVFLYSRRQEEIAGTDGEKTFNRIFGEEARIIAVLYRQAWGQRGFTLAEETAIRNRAFSDGYDFVTFIPLDTPASVPKWLPKPRIWVGLERWGIDGAAAVLEARVREAGGEALTETVLQKAARLGRQRQATRDRDAFLHSPDGVKAAHSAEEELRRRVKEHLEEISSHHSDLSFEIANENRLLLAFSHGFTLHLLWSGRYSNTLDDSVLHVNHWKGRVARAGRITEEGPQSLRKRLFDFDMDASGRHGWRERKGSKRFFSTAQLAEEVVHRFLDQIAGDK